MSEFRSEQTYPLVSDPRAEETQTTSQRIRHGAKVAGIIFGAGVVSITTSLVTAYSLDVGVTAMLDPNDDPSIAMPDHVEGRPSLSCEEAPAMVVYRHGTGLDTSVFSANVTQESVNRLGVCVTGLRSGRTFRPTMSAKAIGDYIRSLHRSEKIVVVLDYVSGGGIGVAPEVVELQKNYGDVLTIGGVVLEAVPAVKENAKKPTGRFFIDNYGLPYGKGAVFLHNLQGQIDEGGDLSQWKTLNDVIINTGLTRVELTKTMLETINKGFQGVDDPEALRNSDGTMPMFEYQCVSTDDTVDCVSARQIIEERLHVPVPMNMIETTMPHMHDKKWIHTIYPIVYERDFIALLTKIKNNTPLWYMRG